jgi:hypothetical protein
MYQYITIDFSESGNSIENATLEVKGDPVNVEEEPNTYTHKLQTLYEFDESNIEENIKLFENIKRGNGYIYGNLEPKKEETKETKEKNASNTRLMFIFDNSNDDTFYLSQTTK